MQTGKNNNKVNNTLISLTEPITDDDSQGINEKNFLKILNNEKHLRKKSYQNVGDLELKFVPRQTCSTVSRLNDENDQWVINELNVKEEHMLYLHDHKLKHDIMARLNTLRRNRELCDVVLFVNEHEIYAHKVVLASISHALFDMFVKEAEDSKNNLTNGNTKLASNEGHNGKKTHLQGGITSDNRFANYYEFSQGEYDCFEAIVNFAYTSKLEISSWKVAELYKTAYCLQVLSIANACARYLAENLNVNNCIGIRKQANFNNDVFLVNKVDSFIAKNIEKICLDSTEFTQLPCIKVRILKNDTQTNDGHYLSEKILRYFQTYPKLSERIEQQIELLVKKSHLLFFNDDDNQPLKNLCDVDDQSFVAACDIVQDYKRSGQTIKNNLPNSDMVKTQYVQHHITGAKSVKMNASYVVNAKYASNESLNSIASTSSTADDEIESTLIAVFNNTPGFWIAIAVLYRRIVVFSIQLSKNDMVCNVIKSENENNNKLTSNNSNHLPLSNYNTHKTKTLHVAHLNYLNENIVNNSENLSTYLKRIPLPTMNQARCSIGAAFINGRIIIFGGYNRGECLNSVEELEVAKTDKWRELPKMIDARGRFDSAVESEKVYAIAGSNGNTDLRSCERYDLKTKKWTSIKSLNKARSHNGCAEVNGFIYCIGGSSDQVVLRDCERYDPKKDEWKSIAPLQTPRFQAGCTSWRGLVVFCAGCDRWNCLDTVEVYDPKTNSWRYLAKLKTPRRGCAVAVIKDSLYVIGGHDGTQSLTSVEILDYPNAHSWRPGPSLNVARANTHAVVTARNAIYVIGGFNGNQFLETIEVFENEVLGWRSWQQIPEQHIIFEEENEGQLENANVFEFL